MASTRISKYQAEKLAEMLATGFTQKERAALLARQASAHRAVADRLFTPAVIAQVKALLESAPLFIRHVAASEYVYLLDQKGVKRDSHRVRLNYECAYGTEDRSFCIDTASPPHIKVTQRQYDAFVEAEEALKELAKRENALRKELLANIQTARTVEKLLEKWPEAGTAIASFFNHVAPPANVEIPLEQLVRRHCSLPALAAPTEEQANG